MKNKIKLAYIRYALLAFLVMFVIILCWGDPVSDADIAEVEKNVMAVMEQEEMSVGGNQMIRRLYDLDPVDYEGMFLYYPSSNMGTNEIFVVKLKNVEQFKTVEQAMLSRVETQLGVFEGYAPEQYAKVEKYVISHVGNYVLFVVSDRADAVVKAFKDSL